MKELIIILFVAVIYVSCRLDVPVPYECPCNNPSDSCADLPLPSVPSTGWWFVGDTSNVIGAKFNPNNDDEFLYSWLNKSGGAELTKYNMVTHEKKVIYTGRTQDQQWGRKGWLLLNINRQIYKIKDNGDSLTQLTFADENYYPTWNNEGDRFIASRIVHMSIGGHNTAYGFSIIYDIKGNPLDSITRGFSGAKWQDSLIIYSLSNEYGIGVTNVNTDTDSYIFNKGFTGEHVNSYTWSPNKYEIYYTTDKNGILKFNTVTKEFTCLKRRCKNDFYWYMSASSDNRKLIMMKEHWQYIGEGTIKKMSKIVMMNTDGSGEEEIKLN